MTLLLNTILNAPLASDEELYTSIVRSLLLVELGIPLMLHPSKVMFLQIPAILTTTPLVPSLIFKFWNLIFSTLFNIITGEEFAKSEALLTAVVITIGLDEDVPGTVWKVLELTIMSSVKAN